ncbi:hypothetical protein BSL78_25354 [Apostichopus japonicus]|uniref:Uncharacterized protein n=1 Tax=Stichopus japonicus TaxID=307972 RepID=A0A2G8JPW0_STIJA|nr:hypothetical protein BSL78_25354 [Apostichopus japonicus]
MNPCAFSLHLSLANSFSRGERRGLPLDLSICNICICTAGEVPHRKRNIPHTAPERTKYRWVWPRHKQVSSTERKALEEQRRKLQALRHKPRKTRRLKKNKRNRLGNQRELFKTTGGKVCLSVFSSSYFLCFCERDF